MKTLPLLKGCACSLLLSAAASAQVLMLDFGATAATGTDRVNSPYHTVNTSFTDTFWNTVGTGDVAAGSLRWSTDTVATGITLNPGATTTDLSTTVGLNNTPSGSVTGSSISTGIYAGTAPGRDGIFTGGSSTNARFVGVQIGGLSAGTYDIYITGRNTNTAGAHTQAFYAGKTSASGDFDPTGTGFLSPVSIGYIAEPTDQENAWTASGGLANYAKFTVTLTSGEFLNLAAHGTAGDSRGFINSIQIVAVPEPSAFGLIAGLATLAHIGLRRRPRAA